ncbi:MAG TPA: carboxypeptidase-like regulatory domain-containing protein [Bryobacteraceae bacterium]|nr:carboxypeptidase-like regulatory domain-containing protein [Bryobacteraceae bacterium]
MMVVIPTQRRLVASIALALGCMYVPAAQAQETRGSIQGRIADSTGALVPGAAVSATNVSTNVTIKATSNQEGAYSLLFLMPGLYHVSASANGFKTSRQENVRLPIHERLQVDFTLQLGDVTEQVQVTAEAPLLQTANSNLGVVIDSRRVSELPTPHGSPLSLMYLSAGTMLARPDYSPQNTPVAVTSDTDYLSVNGAPVGTTDFTIDGTPNTQTANTSNGSGASNSPPADVVEEFKLETAFDASVGHTSGTVMNVSLKTGSNRFHGSGYLFDREPDWNANTFFANRAGQPRGNFTYKRWGASLTGPVTLPKIYKGRDRTFFTYGYEGTDTVNVGTATASVPDATQKTGDFSKLLAISSQYQIYDPATIKATADGRYSIQPFAGNVIPSSRISPISKSLLGLYPAANTTGQADGTNNFYTDAPSPEKYYNHVARLDHVVSDRQRLFGRFSYVHRLTGPYRAYWDGPATGNLYTGDAPQVSLDDVYTLSPTMVVNVRYGYIRYGAAHTPRRVGEEMSKYGFPAQTVAQLGGVINMIPLIATSGLTSIGTEAADYVNSDVHSLFASATQQHGSHNFRFGADLRAYRETYGTYGYSAGYFTFGTGYTQGPYNTSSSSPSGVGQGLAAFLLGQPTVGGIERNANQATQSTYWAFYFHDNWRVSRKLTLDFGLRWEYFGPTTDRYNRATRGFDSTAVQAIEAAAKAAYTAKPDAALAADQFRVRGGLLFAGVDGRPRTLWDRSIGVFAPRFGFAYQALPRVVVRGGFGIYPIDTGVPAERRPFQSGFSQSTSMVPSLDGGQTFLANLANPFPNSVTPPSGSSLGIATFLGQSFTAYDTTANSPYDMHWSLNTQTMLPGAMLLEVGYHGSRSVGLYVSKNINALPNQYLSTSPVRDQTAINYLSQTISNPLAGLLPGSTLNASTFGRSALLQPYPEFGSIVLRQPQGYNWYHALHVRAERRFSHGFTTQVGYGFSKLMEATTFLNAGDPTPHRSIAAYDHPHQLSFSAIFELPFGHGRHIWSGANRLADAFIGGWQLGSVWTVTSGGMPEFGNVLFFGGNQGISAEGQRTIERWFNVDAGFERSSAKQLASNLRTFPLRFSSLRGAAGNIWNFSMIKKFRIREGSDIQFRAEAFNAFNHAWFSIPNTTPTSSAFGTVTSLLGTPRNIQLGLKLAF